MKNNEIAEIFDNFAEILEFLGKKEDFFRIRALRRGAEILRNLSEGIEHMPYEELIKINGIGKGIAEKIIEYCQTGEIQEFKEGYKEIPPGIFDILRIPSLGPKRTRILYDTLGIADITALKKAIEGGAVQKLPGFGEKSAQKILWGIDIFSAFTERRPRGLILGVANRIMAKMRAQKFIKQVAVAGSLRRGADTVHDIDFLALGKNPQKIIDFFCHLPEVEKVLAQGDTKASVVLTNDFQADLRVMTDTWGSALQHFTGSKNHNIALRERARKIGLKISEWGVFKGEKKIAGDTEESVYGAVGLPFIPPELREDTGEIEAADKGKLPRLIELADIKGDLHMHSTYTDGHSTIAELAQKALEKGYKYIAITDHSQAVYIANGLNNKRLAEQKKAIAEVRKKFPKLTIFWGIECDIMKDGNLDFPDEVLADFDFVIGSIHSHFDGDQTERYLKAINNPYINCLGHPTGRKFGSREEMKADYKRIFEACAKTGTALEINSSWQRLDLPSELVREAAEQGAKMIITTDSHIVDELDTMHFGLTVARRGWLEAKDVLNAGKAEEIRGFVERKRVF